MSDSDFSRQAEFDQFVLWNRHDFGGPYALSMSFGARLAATRKALGLTQDDLGRGLGTDGADASKSVVYGWEKDQHYPRVDQLMLICKKLNCSADYLLFGDKERSDPIQVAQAAVTAAVKELTEEERLALFAAIQQPGLQDHEVEAKIPATKRKPKPLDVEKMKAERPAIGKLPTKRHG